MQTCRINDGKGGRIVLNGKKVIILGDRDGIPAPAVEQCLSSLNVEVVFSSTECYV